VIKNIWLEKIFKYPVYNFVFLKKNLNKFIKLKKVFIYSKIEHTKKKSLKIKYLKKNNFKLISQTLYLEKNINKKYKIEPNKDIREAQKKDKLALIEISKNSFIKSRYFQDKMIKKNIARNIKKSWLNNFFKNKRGDKLLVSINKKNRIQGFLLLIKNKNKLFIDLIATSNHFKRKGVATNLINHAIKISNLGCKKIAVYTQKNNISSLKLYQHLGFKLIKKFDVYHFHSK